MKIGTYDLVCPQCQGIDFEAKPVHMDNLAGPKGATGYFCSACKLRCAHINNKYPNRLRLPPMEGVRARWQTVMIDTGQVFESRDQLKPSVRNELVEFSMYRLNQDSHINSIVADVQARAKKQHTLVLGKNSCHKIVKAAVRRQLEWRARREGMKPEELLKENHYRSLGWWYDALRSGKWNVMLEARKVLDQREGLMDEFYNKQNAAAQIQAVQVHVYVPDNGRSREPLPIEKPLMLPHREVEKPADEK